MPQSSVGRGFSRIAESRVSRRRSLVEAVADDDGEGAVVAAVPVVPLAVGLHGDAVVVAVARLVGRPVGVDGGVS